MTNTSSTATCSFPSPIGNLVVVAKDNFIIEIKFQEEHSADQTVYYENTPEILKRCIQELSEYFDKLRKDFTVPIKPNGTVFETSVWNELGKIPFGTTISYQELALRLGDSKKIRAAGRANGKNPIPILIPCHRVIGKDGGFVGYAGGLHRKEWLLDHEGVITKQLSIF